ncbi:hypothetical protein ACJX0J_018223 [Zea mays]
MTQDVMESYKIKIYNIYDNYKNIYIIMHYRWLWDKETGIGWDASHTHIMMPEGLLNLDKLEIIGVAPTQHEHTPVKKARRTTASCESMALSWHWEINDVANLVAVCLVAGFSFAAIFQFGFSLFHFVLSEHELLCELFLLICTGITGIVQQL